jgi:hypothetical protein
MKAVSIVAVWALIAVLATAGCAGRQASRQPTQIALRNGTSRPLASMAVHEIAREATAAVRLGSISPLMPRATTAFQRPEDAPPLPAQAQIEWEDMRGRRGEARVDLDDALRDATGSPDEVLVFEVRPDGSAIAYVQRP